jgi:hypothetical protein
MAVDPRKAAKALKAIMSTASASADTSIASVVPDAEVAKRVTDVLVKMEYATVSNGNIRLTASGEAQKNA